MSIILIIWLVCGVASFLRGLAQVENPGLVDLLIVLPICLVLGPALILRRLLK